jgi:hypothetical protein
MMVVMTMMVIVMECGTLAERVMSARTMLTVIGKRRMLMMMVVMGAMIGTRSAKVWVMMMHAMAAVMKEAETAAVMTDSYLTV